MTLDHEESKRNRWTKTGKTEIRFEFQNGKSNDQAKRGLKGGGGKEASANGTLGTPQ